MPGDRVTRWRARLRRRNLRHVVFIGVTGSTGKTTTKELIAAVASTRFKGTPWPSLSAGVASSRMV